MPGKEEWNRSLVLLHVSQSLVIAYVQYYRLIFRFLGITVEVKPLWDSCNMFIGVNKKHKLAEICGSFKYKLRLSVISKSQISEGRGKWSQMKTVIFFVLLVSWD